MTGNTRVTQSDIARRCGCSRATVSLALSGNPRITEPVRTRISALAAEMGYRPDPALAMLARDRFVRRAPEFRANIAYLIHTGYTPHDLQISHLDLARKRAGQHGYQVQAFDLAAYSCGAAAAKVLYHRGVRGIIIPQMALPVEKIMTDAAWKEFAIVCCAVGWARFAYNTVTNDVFAGARLVWKEVLSRGYTRIGAAMFRHSPLAEDDLIRQGASLALQETSVPKRQRIPLLVDCHPHDRETFLRWFEQHRPEVVVSFISRACEWLVSAGYRVPEDVAFACFNVWPHERYSGGQIPALGDAAVDFLVAQIHQHQRGIPKLQQTLMIEPVWLEGETLPRLAGRT